MKRFRSVLAYVPRYRWAVGAGVLSILLGQLLQTYSPQILRAGVGEIETGLGENLPIDVGRVGGIALAYVGVMAARAFFLWSMRYFTISASRWVERDMRQDFFAHLQSLDDAFFARHKTGDLMSRATSDLEAVRSALGPAVMYIVNSLISVPLTLAWMLWMDWVLTLFALIPLVGIAILVRWSAPRIMSFSRTVQDVMGRLSAAAQENFAGVRVVKAYAQEPRQEDGWDDLSRQYVAASIDAAKVRGVMMGGIKSLGGAGVLIILAYCGLTVLGIVFSGRKIDVATLVAFQAYQVSLVWPMMAFGWVLAMFQRGAAALERIDAIRNARPEVVEPEEPAPVEALRGAIEVRNLTFGFDPDRPVLVDICFQVAPGGTLGVVGRTGSGKSTLVSLLTRAYPVPRGTILFDGVDSADLTSGVLRTSIAVVPQVAFLFSQSIADNISFGARGLEDRDALVREAATLAALDKDVQGFSRGYATRVGERGVTLSGGQKQRVAIARAVLRRPTILILDDCLSAVDARTEQEILASLDRVIAERTSIIVSHRLSAVKDADEIIVLDEGRIVARGRHEDLITRRGYYADTWVRQRLEDELGIL